MVKSLLQFYNIFFILQNLADYCGDKNLKYRVASLLEAVVLQEKGHIPVQLQFQVLHFFEAL